MIIAVASIRRSTVRRYLLTPRSQQVGDNDRCALTPRTPVRTVEGMGGIEWSEDYGTDALGIK